MKLALTKQEARRTRRTDDEQRRNRTQNAAERNNSGDEGGSDAETSDAETSSSDGECEGPSGDQAGREPNDRRNNADREPVGHRDHTEQGNPAQGLPQGGHGQNDETVTAVGLVHQAFDIEESWWVFVLMHRAGLSN